jgi:AcrR family transcriptional regulator
MMARRTGRRRGSPDTRESILEAARRLFAEKGFDATTVRAIAAEAQVDPAMIHHYFGTKEELFTQTVAMPIDPRVFIAQVVTGGADGIGERLVSVFIRIWDSPVGAAGVALIRSAMSSEWSARLVREFLTTQILRRIIGELELDPAQAPMRASLVATQMAGLAMVRYVLKIEPMASLPPEQVVAAIGPTIQRYLTGDIS